MQKLLIYWVLGASLLLGGCGTVKKWGEAVTPSVENLPLMYRPEIQQGNVISQEAINQLRPGMAKRQVRYLLGTPILVDVFHQERWDYVYSVEKASEPRRQEHLSLFFENDLLVTISGDFAPSSAAPAAAAEPDQ